MHKSPQHTLVYLVLYAQTVTVHPLNPLSPYALFSGDIIPFSPSVLGTKLSL